MITNSRENYISYNVHDELWVMRELLPQLEGEQGWKLCLHHRDFEPGKPIMDNIVDGIYSSRKTICVISCHYLESEWCSRDIQVASFRLFDEKKRCSHPGIPREYSKPSTVSVLQNEETNPEEDISQLA